MEKRISIIIPCYNVEKYIDRCFTSLVNQTIGVDCLELIFVDDASTDGTWERLLELERQFPESVVIIHCEENGRQGRARNIGLECASAPYIGFVDSDDWVEPDMYEKLYHKIVENNCDIAMCRSYRDTGVEGRELPPRQTGEASRMLKIDTTEKRRIFIACSSMEFLVWNKLYRAELLRDNAIYFPEQLAYEDHYFTMLLYFYARKVYILEERLYHYFVNEQSTVMATGATHHFDILTVNTLLWEECEKRGLMQEYKTEISYQFLALCYLISMKMMILRLPQVPYDYFVRLREETLKRVPDYKENPYVQELVTDANKMVLELLSARISEADLHAFCDALRGYIQKGLLKI